ncbi:DUF6902 family protein [Roseobacter weihaiensis]|uniref:DUF6902 family protein n=1 Tax=Roseobacter weihaiensis TaxID=2763262 RepID=UPI001D0B45A6|nr:hypothetical protein [Roseobacter sp. H9]
MSNVVPIGLPRRPNTAQRQAALINSFARHRRQPEDVFWLKENAEVLNVLATGGAALPAQSLDVFKGFYDGLEQRLRFFPQYYRFLLSICLDLEDLGYEGEKGRALCQWVAQADLPTSELSDLQRAEAQRLLARRGCGRLDGDLEQRLRRFIGHSETFALPNKKAAYELTHIVFYLSEYGKRSPGLSEAAVVSLEFAGLLAYLDQDIDLLSEICVALRFAGETPSAVWEDWLSRELAGFVLSAAPDGPAPDAYHEYLVTSWWAELAGLSGFPGMPQTAGVMVTRHATRKGPLRAISEVLYGLGPGRTGDWDQMRAIFERTLAAEHQQILEGAARSSTRFDAFFAGFSRAM